LGMYLSPELDVLSGIITEKEKVITNAAVEFSSYIDYKTSMATPLPTYQTQIPQGVIDLGAGDPPLSLLPLDLLREASQICLSQDDNSFLQYGTERGYGPFRAALADFLGKSGGLTMRPENLFVTNGISGTLNLICELFTQPGDTIFIEEPTYFLALRIFADHKLNLVSLPTDEAGLVIEALEQKLKEVRPKFLYFIPTFQNPSGHTLTQERRDRLVELSQKYDFLLVADEVYQLLSYTQSPPKSFAAYADAANVIAMSSFSKILAPGLRLGWLHAHPKIIKQFVECGLLDSGGGLNPFTSAIVTEVIKSGGLEKNIARLNDIYGARVKVMDEVLRQYLPQLTYTNPHGGYFFWARLPDGMDASNLREKVTAFKVDFRPGVRFSSTGGLRDHIRIGFAFYEVDEIVEGITRLANCLNSK
jgi:2-aminoadipate transaminase